MYSFSISALRHIIPAPLFTFHMTSKAAQTLNIVVERCYSEGGVDDIATLKHRNSIHCAKYRVHRTRKEMEGQMQHYFVR